MCGGGVENSVLLKCRKLRREDQETSDWIVSRISLFYDMSLVSVVIEISFLSNLQGHYRYFWRRDFLEVETNIKQSKPLRAINLTNPRLARTKIFAEQRLNLSVV